MNGHFYKIYIWHFLFFLIFIEVIVLSNLHFKNFNSYHESHHNYIRLFYSTAFIFPSTYLLYLNYISGFAEILKKFFSTYNM